MYMYVYLAILSMADVTVIATIQNLSTHCHQYECGIQMEIQLKLYNFWCLGEWGVGRWNDEEVMG